jgi:Skp family chaperone for outer membrane proteins
MKKIILALLVLIAVGDFSASAQKIGHLDYLACIDTLQTYKTAESKKKELTDDYKFNMDEIGKEYERLMGEYQQYQATWSDIIKESKASSITYLEQRAQLMDEEYQKNIQIVSERYYIKIEEWLKEAVKIVGTRRSLDYIFYYQEGGAFWVNPERGVDVSNEIITELLKLEIANPVKEPGQ